MAKVGHKVKVTKQFERTVMGEKIIVKTGAICSASHNTSTDLWKVAFKGRWVILGDTVTASEYLVVLLDDKSNHYRPIEY
jgi:hypothetical protein